MDHGWGSPRLNHGHRWQQHHPPLAMIESVAPFTFSITFIYQVQQLSSVSSGSSSPTSVSPNLTDDDKEEDLVPRPVPIRVRGNAICVMYKKGGKCPRGKDCIFKHVQDVVGTSMLSG